MKHDSQLTQPIANLLLCAGILEILRNDWGNRAGEYEAYWLGYDTLKDQMHENGIIAEIEDIILAMNDLSKQNKVVLKDTYNNEGVLSGRGWFACP